MLGTWPIMWTKYCVEGVFIYPYRVVSPLAVNNVLLHPLSTFHYPLSTIHISLSSTLSFPFVYPTKHIQVVVYSLVSLSPLRSVSLDLLRPHRDYYSLEPRALSPPTLPLVSPLNTPTINALNQPPFSGAGVHFLSCTRCWTKRLR